LPAFLPFHFTPGIERGSKEARDTVDSGFESTADVDVDLVNNKW
jgi:hypothetical protein